MFDEIEQEEIAARAAKEKAKYASEVARNLAAKRKEPRRQEWPPKAPTF